MATKCVIHFDNNPQGVFYGGQLLSGTVQLITQKEKTVRAIHITIEGYASVHWTESRSRRENDRTVHYTVDYRAHDQYLSSRTYVLGREGGDSIDLHPGTYSYNFQVALPHQLPSSLEGEYGHIRYQVVVTIDRPWRFDNVFKKPFTVLYSLDLNRDFTYKTPIFLEDEKTFCCMCCQSGLLVAKLSVPFSGYAPGQKVPFVFKVENESTVDCENIRVKLVQEIVFTSDTPERDTRKQTRKVAEKNLGPVLKLSNKEFKNVLELPSIPPSSINSCRIISTSYSFYGVVHTPGCHTNLEMIAPFTVGSVPLYESATNPANIITQQPTAPQLPDQGDSPPGYNTIVPPSYEEATAKADKQYVPDDVDPHAQVEPYVPKYPVYYNFATAPLEEGNSSDDRGLNTVSYGWKS